MAEDFNIRVATRADISGVDALLAKCYPKLLKPDYPPSVMVTALPLISKAQPKLVTCGSYYVAETASGEIIGVGGITRDKAIATKGHVRHVGTDPDMARRGVGRALLTHALDQAAVDGMGEIECWSTFTAERFYASLGFETIGPIDVPLQPGITFPSLRMMLGLAKRG